MNPVLETDRLRLRRPAERDGEAYARFFMAGRAKYMGAPTATLREGWRFFYTELGHWDLRGYGMFAVTPKDDDTALGLVGPWYPHTWPEREIGWMLFEGHEGKGYATEAAVASRAWAYRELGWTGAVSYIDPENTASARVAERCGARLDPDAEGCDPDDLVYRHPGPEAC
ncbi:MAG: GNAT family N-acetyltransferase [Pseudomonadota bacterium]